MVEGCNNHVHQWLTSNRLRLKPDKTEGMWCAISRRVTAFKSPSVNFGQSVIQPTSSVLNLGVKLRSDLRINDQVTAAVRRCNYNIIQLRAVPSTHSRDSLRDATYALVLSRLDYCNSLYVNAPVTQMRRLQMTINIAARVVSGRRRFDPNTEFINAIFICYLLSNVYNLKSAQWLSRLFTIIR